MLYKQHLNYAHHFQWHCRTQGVSRKGPLGINTVQVSVRCYNKIAEDLVVCKGNPISKEYRMELTHSEYVMERL